MPKLMKKFASPPLVALLCLSMLMGLTPTYASAAKAETAIEHQPLEYVVPERRIKIEAKVTDPAGVQLVRCYFRATRGSADFAHVDLVKNGDTFVGELPAPVKGTAGVEYALLVVNGQRAVVKSGNLLVPVKYDQSPPAWQETPPSQRKLAVYMEHTPTPQTISGFDDRVAVSPTDPAQCYGALAGLTDASASATSASGASFAGAVPVTYGGISNRTALLVAGGVILVGGGVGIAAAASGGGGGGGGTSTPPCQCSGDTTVTKTTVNMTVLVDDETVRDDDMVVHVKVNGNFVLTEEMLNHSGTTVSINLNGCPSVNTITVVAINQSDEPPNRGALIFSNPASGKPSKLNWSLMAGEEQNFRVCVQ